MSYKCFGMLMWEGGSFSFVFSPVLTCVPFSFFLTLCLECDMVDFFFFFWRGGGYMGSRSSLGFHDTCGNRRWLPSMKNAVIMLGEFQLGLIRALLHNAC